MQLIQRATPGSYVKADLTGTGDWVVGRIVMMDRKDWVTIDTPDGQVKVVKPAVYKATKDEYEEYLEKVVDSTIIDEGTIVKPEYRAKYVDCVSPQGRKSLHNGDEVALELEGKSLNEAYAIVATKTKTSVHDLYQRWSHLNNGQQRMLVGNYLRRHYKKLQAF